MVASASSVIVDAVVVVCLLALLAAAAGFVAWRMVRRRLRVLRAHALVRAGEALGAAVGELGTRSFGRSRSATRALPVGRVRRDMWRSVEGATQAVRVADAAGGAVGDLPTLCRRLHVAAGEVDGLLTMAEGLDPRAGEAAEVRRQAADVVTASSRVRLAATAAASAAAQGRVHDLVLDADLEVQSVAAGLSRLHGFGRPA